MYVFESAPLCVRVVIIISHTTLLPWGTQAERKVEKYCYR